MRRIALLLLVVAALPLRALPWDYRAVYRSGLARVPQRSILEVGDLDGYGGQVAGMGSFLAEVLGKPIARSDSVATLPWCPGKAPRGAPTGYRLVQGPELHEAVSGAFVLARACKRIVDGQPHARIRETYVYVASDDKDRWYVKSAEQHAERDASTPLLLTRSMTGDVWSTAFAVLAAVAAIALVAMRRRFGSLRWEDALIGYDDEPQGVVWTPSSDRRVLPLVGGWAVAVTIGCVWLLIAWLSVPAEWTWGTAALGIVQVLGGACLLSTIHSFAMRPLPIRGPLVSAALGVCVGWIAAMLSPSIPGMTESGVMVGGALYGALVGVTNLLRAAARRQQVPSAAR